MKILYTIIIILFIGCTNTNNIKDMSNKNVNIEAEQEEQDKNILKSILFYFWVITGGM